MYTKATRDYRGGLPWENRAFAGGPTLPRVASLAVVIVVASASGAAGTRPPRPRVLGISHVAFQVSDLAAARRFYEDFLGYRARPVTPARGGPGEPVLVPVNDRQ